MILDGTRREEFGPGPTIAAVDARAYQIPTPQPEADGTLSWDATTMVVVRISCHNSEVEGLGWTYADTSCVELIKGKLTETIMDKPVLDVPAAWSAMQHKIRNLGRPGLVSCSISAVDIALTDAAARLLGLPIDRLLGRCHDQVALYGSGGFTSQTEDQLVDQLRDWTVRRRLPRVKIKIGESGGRRVDRDLERMRLARQTIGDDVELYVDANGGYSIGQAKRVGSALDEVGAIWFEEPVSSDDLAGLAMLRDCCSADIAAGEYGYDLPYFARMLPCVDCLQVDLTRCGGFTEWRRISAVAAAANRQVSAHCAPNLSVYAGAATQNFRHIEWFVDHDRIESELFDGTLDPDGGIVTPGPGPGHGLTLRSDAAATYAV
ncbi:mandelate racemase [Microlunatus elymi]|uniref:Mandelate racemase n=1 Tax=Microlunatus elymi TaxID=2596828 RepID=A0A516Q222_9ACTN|nr:enolase C-terminal domain-like protein [Microlunatus elymi]QDP97476.1 mandelate racemase [Microlunatus elymi]